MPASSLDPISSSLQSSIESSRREFNGDNIESQLSISAKRLLLHPIDYKETGTQSSILLNPLKNKYLVLKTSSNSCHVNGDDVPRKSLDSKLNGNSSNSSPDTLPAPKFTIFPPENVKLGWSGKEPIGSGFSNLGNTCYLNSTLQALFHVPAFVNWLSNDQKHFNSCEQKNVIVNECMVCAMHKTLVYSQKNTGSSIKPVQITSKLKSICKHFQFGHQEDAHEFLRYLIESLEKSYLAPLQPIKLDSYSRETTPLNQIFGGYIRTEVTCLECAYVSTTFQHFQDLLLDIRQASTIDDALENYFSKERLDEDNAYRCEHCRRKVSAYKKFSIEKPPNVLCLQLKRFNTMGGKNTKPITINQSLDLSKFRYKGNHYSQRLKYKIASLILHYGASTSCGHYTALGFSAQGNLYTFDDSQVYSSAFSNVSSSAYVIMYELDHPSPVQRTVKSVTSSNSSYTNGITLKQENSLFVQRPVSSSCSSSTSSVERPEPQKKSWKQGKVYTSNGAHPQSTASTTNSSTSSSSSTCNKSLVPYMSDSGSDSDDSSKIRTNQNLTNGHPTERSRSPLSKPRDSFNSFSSSPLKNSTNSAHHSAPNNTIVNSVSITAANLPVSNSENCDRISQTSNSVPSQEIVNRVSEVCNSVQSNGWLITDSSSKSKVAVSAEKSVERGVGHWSVTEAKHSESTNNQSLMNGSSNQCWRKPLPPSENGHSNHNNNNNNSSSVGNGNANSNKTAVLNHLQNSSHLGYGNKVNSWNGNQSHVNREAERDRYEANKRCYSQSYNDEIDRGKVKKLKFHKFEFTNGNGNSEKCRTSTQFDHLEEKFSKSQQRSYRNYWSRSQPYHIYRNYNKNRHPYKHNNGRSFRDNFWRSKK